MIDGAKLWIERMATGVELAAAVIIGLAAIEAFLRALPIFLHRGVPQHAKVALRLALGRWLGVGLEFALAADILRTAVAPNWQDIGQLSAIAALRIVLNFTLEKEIERTEKSDHALPTKGSS
jgi:uncharacterized membrane protein